MANVFDDFVGSAGAVDSAKWNPVNNPTVGTGGGFTRNGSGKGLLTSSNAGSYNTNAFIRAWFNESNRADGEIIGDFNPSNHGDTLFRVNGRAASAADSNRYSLRVNTSNSTIAITEIIGGTSETQIGGAGGTASFTFSSGTKYSYRFKIEGTTISGKVWLSSGSEPGSYQVTATDGTYTTGRWGIEQTAGSATSTSTATIEEVGIYDLTTTVTDSASVTWATRARINDSVAVTWATKRAIEKTLAVSWDTDGIDVMAVSKSLTVNWSVVGESSIPAGLLSQTRAAPLPFRPVPPFSVTVYDKAFKRLGWVDTYEVMEATLVHNDVDVAEFAIPSTHIQAENLRAPGARVVITYDGKTLMSGPISSKKMEGPSSQAVMTFTVVSDFRLVRDILGWPVPGNAITAQGTATRYHKVTGPAETVVKTLIQANLDRFDDLPVTPIVVPSQGRGDIITVSTRMMPLPDRLFPLVTQAGIGVRVYQSGDKLYIDCYEPVTRSRPLTEEAGTLSTYEYSEELPTVTRVVVGGPGEGTSKEFLQLINTAREAKYGMVIEQFVEADGAETIAEMTEKGNEVLKAGAEQFALTVTLAESRTFRYGLTLNNGDIVTVTIPPGITYTDVVYQTKLTHSLGEAVKVEPTVGSGSTDPNVRISRAVGALMRSSRDLKARS